MIKKTLIVSDLHLGSGSTFDTFAGADALPALLEKLGHEPLRVILNGDTADFLMNEDPLELDTARAVGQAAAICAAPDSAAVLKALGRVVARGGELVVRLGNHDIELALPEVQPLFCRALALPGDAGAKVRFERGDQPAILHVGGARILITHGEQNDPWNKVDYAHLPGPGSGPVAHLEDFTYSPGSRLVKTLLNPLKQRYGMRFADLLKPDFQGATLTALAVNPLAVRTIFQGSTLTMMWQLFRQSAGALTFAPGDSDVDLGLARAIGRAQLTGEEQLRLQQLLGDSAALSFGEEDDSLLESVRRKLVHAGLSTYARMQRSLVGDSGERYFALDPEPDEWTEAERLAAKFDVSAVVLGHTHSARFRCTSALTLVNTGTWIWLMQLPTTNDGTDKWTAFLDSCRRNPRLDPAKGSAVPLVQRFTAALIAPKDADTAGATLRLVQWGPRGLDVLGESHLHAAVPR